VPIDKADSGRYPKTEDVVRIQTVEREGNPLLYDLLLRFEQATVQWPKTTPSFAIAVIEVCPRKRVSVYKAFACARLIFDPAD